MTSVEWRVNDLHACERQLTQLAILTEGETCTDDLSVLSPLLGDFPPPRSITTGTVMATITASSKNTATASTAAKRRCLRLHLYRDLAEISTEKSSSSVSSSSSVLSRGIPALKDILNRGITKTASIQYSN